MINIKEIISEDEKSNICNNILRTLPNWFGVESAVVEFTEQVRTMPFYTAVCNEKIIGFVALKVHNSFSVEVYVMGILKEFQRQGIGKMLIECCEKYCKENKVEFLTVKTLDESAESKNYQKTRLFYLSMGFKPLEVFPLLWDKENPCLFMVKNVL